MPGIYDFGIRPLNLSQDFEQGQEKARQNSLRQLAGDYYGKQDPMLGQLARLGGDAGGMQKDMQGQQDRQREQLGQFAALLTSAPPAMRPGLYKQMHAQLSQIVPDAPPEYTPEIDGMAQQIAAVYGKGQGVPASLQEFGAMTQGMTAADVAKARRINLGLDPRALAPQVYAGANGIYGIDRANYSAAPINVGQGPQAPAAPPQGNSDAVIATANQMAAAGVPEQYINQWMAKQPGMTPVSEASQGATTETPAQVGYGSGQQLQGPQKQEAQPEFEKKAAFLRARGVPEDQITKMVLGGSGEGAVQSLGDTTKTGAEYLSTLKPNEAAQVRALADGRMAFPSGTALKSPHWQAMLEAVSQYDPEFDAVNYNARNKTRAAFTAGSEAKTINALNTVAEHLGTFSDNAAALNNTRFPMLNRPKNWIAGEMGDPKIASFNTNKKAVADEVAKVWRASGGSEADIQENLKNLDGAQSPEQLNAAIGTLTELIYGKVSALQDQYNNGMGTTRTPRSLVSPEAKAAFDKTLTRKNGGEAPGAKYKVGQIVMHGNKKFRVTGGDMNDPDVEEMK